MTIQVHCPNPKCKKLLQAPDDYAGRTARCPGCGDAFTIPDPQTADPLIGAMLGPLEIKSKLGQGAMGAVYLAENTSLDRTVAVKVLPKEVVRDDQPLSLREAKPIHVRRLLITPL